MNLFTKMFSSFKAPDGPILAAVKLKKRIGVGEISPVVRLVQTALLGAGHVLLPDGEFGPITEAALKTFQAARGLVSIGYVNEATARALDAVSVKTPSTPIPGGSVIVEAPWLAEMRAITGTREVPGSANSPIIMSWRADISRPFPDMTRYAATYTGDAIPWCGFGLAGCMARRGIRPPFGSVGTDRFMWAASWSRWGRKLSKPVTGCVMTFTRSGGGHVALLERMEGNTAIIRGCNQSDMVNVARKDMSTFTAATWPPGWPVVETLAGVVTNVVASGSEA